MNSITDHSYFVSYTPFESVSSKVHVTHVNKYTNSRSAAAVSGFASSMVGRQRETTTDGQLGSATASLI